MRKNKWNDIKLAILGQFYHIAVFYLHENLFQPLQEKYELRLVNVNLRNKYTFLALEVRLPN